MFEIKIGIDATRTKSGGGKAHLIGVINSIENIVIENNIQIHVWSYTNLLEQLPNKKWLVKHEFIAENRPIIFQLAWQYFVLKKEAKKKSIDIMLNTDAGSISRFEPSITMSRDMLSYEKGEMKRFGMSLQRLRLFMLKIIQNRSLKKSSAAIFLTKYASDVIQESTGALKDFKIIPHGVNDNFRLNLQLRENFNEGEINCIYVSNLDLYKHQFNVAKAIFILRTKRNINLNIQFVGGGEGKLQTNFNKLLNQLDPQNTYLVQKPFVNHNFLPQLIGASDIFIFASSCENMPNTLLEGMSSGLPIACSDRGPMPEILKDAGVYFNPENIDNIVETIDYLINNQQIRKQLGNAAKLYSENYSWSKCGSETIKYLIEILNKETLRS